MLTNLADVDARNIRLSQDLGRDLGQDLGQDLGRLNIRALRMLSPSARLNIRPLANSLR